MIIVAQSSAALKRFLAQSGLRCMARQMLLRMVLAFIMHRGRMSCSAAAGSIATEPIHRGQLTRFLARSRWQRHDFNSPLRQALLARETRRGRFIFIVDATLVSQAGLKTQNTYSTGNRGRHPAQGRRYNKRKIVYKKVHSFTFGLLITPSGIRIPMQTPHYTQEYCQAHGLKHRTTAEAAAEMIRTLPLPPEAQVVVIGDTAYESQVVREACEQRGYLWIFPANANGFIKVPGGSVPSCGHVSRIGHNCRTRPSGYERPAGGMRSSADYPVGGSGRKRKRGCITPIRRNGKYATWVVCSSFFRLRNPTWSKRRQTT